MFVVDLRLLALGAMVLPDPRMSGIVIDAEVAGRLGHRLLRLDRQCYRTLLNFSRILRHRGFTHRTHLAR
jgi:membrane-bound metal-dependent hydrolase YbcI (DUF457 family)